MYNIKNLDKIISLNNNSFRLIKTSIICSPIQTKKIDKLLSEGFKIYKYTLDTNNKIIEILLK
jgi:hypothetical protein